MNNHEKSGIERATESVLRSLDEATEKAAVEAVVNPHNLRRILALHFFHRSLSDWCETLRTPNPEQKE